MNSDTKVYRHEWTIELALPRVDKVGGGVASVDGGSGLAATIETFAPNSCE
jgi:hypothetical protein